MFRTFTHSEQRKVLVVEDNLSLRTFLYRILSPNYRISTASNGLEALAMIKMEMPDLIITDIIMPHMDGYELIRNIRKSGLYRHIPVLVLSACNAEDIMEQLNENETINEVIEKPFSPQTLISKISNAFPPCTV